MNRTLLLTLLLLCNFAFAQGEQSANADVPNFVLLGGLAGVLLLLAFCAAFIVHIVAVLRGGSERPRAGVEPSKPWPRTNDAPIYSERRPERRPPLE